MILYCFIIADLYAIPPEEAVLVAKQVEDSAYCQVLPRAWISSALHKDTVFPATPARKSSDFGNAAIANALYFYAHMS